MLIGDDGGGGNGTDEDGGGDGSVFLECLALYKYYKVMMQ